jgi:hypothetical protein
MAAGGEGGAGGERSEALRLTLNGALGMSHSGGRSARCRPRFSAAP